MNTTNFEDDLPSLSDEPAIAVAKIREKMGFYSTQGLFQRVEFVHLFSKRITTIVENLPREEKIKKELEQELAYICHDVYINHGLVIASDMEKGRMRAIELMLDEEGLLRGYIDFVTGATETVNINDPDFFKHFLDYLIGYFPGGVNDVMFYIRACIRISQVSHGGMGILQEHLVERYSTIPGHLISTMIDENHGYMGSTDLDMSTCLSDIMREENLTAEEARRFFEEMKEDCAGLHLFLGEIYNQYILPKIGNMSLERQKEMRQMLNDFRDIADPEGFVPVYFDTGNTIEAVEYERATEKGRRLH